MIIDVGVLWMHCNLISKCMVSEHEVCICTCNIQYAFVISSVVPI